MLRMIWGSGPQAQTTLNILSSEERELRQSNAEQALEMIMNEDFAGAATVLEAYDDAFHKTGRAVKTVIDALLTFDKEDIRHSAAQLEDALAICEVEYANAKAVPGSVFPAGAEFNVIIALVLLQLALTGILSESIPEAMKAVWKMKRCYNIFYGLHKHMLSNRINLELDRDVEKTNELQLQQKNDDPEMLARLTTLQLKMASGHGSDLSRTDFFTACATVSGHGLFSLLISISPPTIARLLSVIGFKGNKAQALRDLWTGAEAPNIHGAIAALGLLGYFGTIVAFSDILGDEDDNLRRLSALLAKIETRYPNSSIWKLQSARMQQHYGDMTASIAILNSINPGKQMKQLEVLKYQDLGFAHIVTGEWRNAADCLIKVESMNDWSQTLLNYVIGSCLIELYRDTGEQKLADEAAHRYAKCNAALGKKKIMGKALALETYFKRKITRWTATSSTGRLEDGMAVSPMMELCHNFNTWKKMNVDRCRQSLILVNRPGGVKDRPDDIMLRRLFSAALKRRIQDWTAFEDIEAASSVLRKDLKVIPHAELWALPWTYYERAACLWARDGRSQVKEIRNWIDRARSFGDTEMESRLAARIATAIETLDQIT